MVKSHRTISSTASAATTANSNIASLFDESKSKRWQQQQPSGYSTRNDRPAATSSTIDRTVDATSSLSSSNQSNNPPTSTTPSAEFKTSPFSNGTINSEGGNDIDSNSNINYNHDLDNINNNTYRDADDERRTISMTVFFLVFMVLYIGFCFFYQRKRKVRARVMDDENDNTSGGAEGGGGRSRRQQLRENQIVLDESNNAARRARANAEAMVKYKQRKLNIQNALFLRLIVDVDDADRGGRDDLECNTATSTSGVVAVPPPPPIARKIVTIQEEDSDIEEDRPSMERSESEAQGEGVASTNATLPHGDGAEDEHALEVVNEDNTSPPPTMLLSHPSTPPRVASSLSPTLPSDLANTPSPSSSRPPPLRSPSRRLMHAADALNCGNIHSRINQCSNHYSKCSNNSVSSSSHDGGNATRPGCDSKSSDTMDPRSISHSEMFSRYDEECNICLTQFQVGDSAAWSMQYGIMILSSSGSMMCGGAATTCDNSSGHPNNPRGGASLSNDEHDVCKHVFHEECISRWLLVRDGCPICRRSYFPATTTDANENAIDLEQGVSAEILSESGMGRVEGNNANRTTSLAVNMANEGE